MAKVLVAHGNTQALRDIVQSFQDLGMEVIATPDGGDAFARFFEESPELVLCSVGLPSLSGPNFARMVTSQDPNTTVVLLGVVDPEDDIEGVHVLEEPLDLDLLRVIAPGLLPEAPTHPENIGSSTASVFIQAALKRFQRDNNLLVLMDEAGMAMIAERAEHQVRPPNDLIIRQGDPGDGFYFLVEGQVRVTLEEKGGAEVARIHPGGFFGEMALLNDQPRSASVWTVGPATLLWFEREAFMPVLEAYPIIREVLSGVALKRTEENLWAVLFDDDDVNKSLQRINDGAELGSLGELEEGVRSDHHIPPRDGLGPMNASDEDAADALLASFDAPPETKTDTETETDRDLVSSPPPGEPHPAPVPNQPSPPSRIPWVGLPTAVAAAAGFLLGVLVTLSLGPTSEPHPTTAPPELSLDLEPALPAPEPDLPPMPAADPPGAGAPESPEAAPDAIPEAVPEVPLEAPPEADPSEALPLVAPGDDANALPGEPPPAGSPGAPSEGAQGVPSDEVQLRELLRLVSNASEAKTPEDIDARKRLRRSLMSAFKAGDPKEAARVGKELRQRYLVDWEAHWYVAEAQRLSNDRSGAIASYRYFVSAFPSTIFTDNARFRTGELLLEEGRAREAKAFFTEVAQDPESDYRTQAKSQLERLP